MSDNLDLTVFAPVLAALALVFAFANSGAPLRDTDKAGALIGVEGAVLTRAAQ